MRKESFIYLRRFTPSDAFPNTIHLVYLIGTLMISTQPLHLQVSLYHYNNCFAFLLLYNKLTHSVPLILDSFVETIGDNLATLQLQCGRQFDSVLKLVEDTNLNLRNLQKNANLALDLFQCRNINELYVNTVHEAGCTYSVDAMAWMLACSIVISVCGLTMIMLRSSYYPEQYLGISEKWITKETTTKSASFESRSSSKSLNNTKSPDQQPSTPPRILFEVDPDSESVECSPERLPPPQTAPPASPPRPSRDSIEI